MKKSLLPAMILAIMAYGCRTDHEEQLQIDPLVQTPHYSLTRVNQSAYEVLTRDGEFHWDQLSSEEVSSALTHNDSTLVVGFKPASFVNVNERLHEIDITSQEWVDAKTKVINNIDEILNALDVNQSAQDLIVMEHETLPFIKIKTYQVAVIERLREMKEVRYAEPNSFTYDDSDIKSNNNRITSDSGCDVSPAGSIPSADYVTVAPGSKIPWNYYAHNIPAAWNYSTGDNITVGLIDTGISPDQSNLNGNFASGYSTGRSRTKYGTYVSSWWWWASPDGPNDQCGHGTQMAGTISGPRTSTGSSIGVAYKCDLAAVRGTGDVIINGGSEKDGVTDALVLLGNRSDVKIISMSIGDVFSSGQVEDGVRYAYGRGKMIIAAAGTSLSWTSWYGVIFPATMNETIAVTGIRDNGYNRCNTCHDGSKVDFVVTMQRNSNTDRTSLTQAMSGNQPAYVGGSSVATATTAGIAALIWATNPSQTREQVLNRMKLASDFYPSRDGNFGWGKIDALAAVQ